jgi:predicted MFS family arabinose efflux permease
VLAVVRGNREAPGTAAGIVLMGIYAGAAAGPVVMGAVVEHTSFETAWLLCAPLVLGAAALVWRVGRAHALLSPAESESAV